MFAKTTQQRGESPKKHKPGAGNSSKPGGDGDSSVNAGDIGSPSRASLLSGQGGTGSPKNPGGNDAGAPVEHISKHQMKSLLQSEYTDEKLNKGFDDCCGSIKPCSEKIAQIAVGIEELYSLNPNQIVGNVVEMEESIQKKCAELKKQKGMVRQLLSQSCSETKDNSTQVVIPQANKESQIYVENSNFGQQVDFQPKEIEKVVEKIVEKPVV